MDFTFPRSPPRIAAMNASSSSVEMISAMPSRPRGKIPELFLGQLFQEFETGAGVYVWKLASQEPGSISLPHRGRGPHFEPRRGPFFELSGPWPSRGESWVDSAGEEGRAERVRGQDAAGTCMILSLWHLLPARTRPTDPRRTQNSRPARSSAAAVTRAASPRPGSPRTAGSDAGRPPPLTAGPSP